MIYLASKSPRRRALLEQLGVEHRVLEVSADEARREGEDPGEYVRRLAAAKAQAGAAAIAEDARAPVLGADTAVLLGDEILGKPRDAAHARELLARLSGRSHSVLSAVALLADEDIRVRTSETRVWFRPISEGECEAYCATGEPLDKAGGYALQGRAAAFVSRIDGSYSGVVGLPLYETAELLTEVGISVLRTTGRILSFEK